MYKITIICSGHRENGLCNADQLLEIFRAIEPEVVFEEIRPSELDSYGTLETRAIQKYRECKFFQRVPVDRYDIPSNLFVAETDRVFDCVKQSSQEYLILNEAHDYSVHRY